MPAQSGEKENYITYKAYQNDEVVIDAENKTRDSCIIVYGKKYIQFIGLTLNGAKTGAFKALDGSQYLILDGLTCSNSRFGIVLYGSSNPVSYITIKNSKIYRNSKYGIWAYRKVYDSEIGPNNHIFSNGGEEMSFGLEIGTEFPGIKENGSRRLIIVDNEIDNNDVQGIRTWNAMNVLINNNHCHHNGATGIQVENGCENIIVERNRCDFNAQSFEYETGIWIDGTERSIVKENIVVGNKIGIMVTTSKNVIMRNNLVVENNRGIKNLVNAMGICVNNNSYDSVIVHNTLYKNCAPYSARGGMTFGFILPIERIVVMNNILCETLSQFDLSFISGGVRSDHNLIFNSRGIFVDWRGKNVSWEQYKNLSSEDARSIAQVDPKFISINSDNYSLAPGSPAIDTGGFLTRAIGSGKGRMVKVLNSSFFCDGFGMVKGDFIKVGNNKRMRIQHVDYYDKTIMLEEDISWSDGDGVSYAYEGLAPDMGAIEYGVHEYR